MERGKKEVTAKVAKTGQRILWHTRGILLTGLLLYNLYAYIISFQQTLYIQLHGVIIVLYFMLGLLEDYLECKTNCKIRGGLI
jgi:hypothetical protein